MFQQFVLSKHKFAINLNIAWVCVVHVRDRFFFFFFFLFFFSILLPVQDNFSSFETDQSVGGVKKHREFEDFKWVRNEIKSVQKMSKTFM